MRNSLGIGLGNGFENGLSVGFGNASVNGLRIASGYMNFQRFSPDALDAQIFMCISLRRFFLISFEKLNRF